MAVDLSLSQYQGYFTPAQVESITADFKRKYPGKNVVVNKDKWGRVIEIICEVEPSSEHPEYSLAIVAAKHIAPHYHKKSTEEYKILEGSLALYKNGEIVRLSPGDKAVIKPYEVHGGEAVGAGTTVSFANGFMANSTIDFVLFEAHSSPGGQFEDHIIIPDVPCIMQPDDFACALACYAMSGSYFVKDSTLDKVAKLSKWQKGKLVWPYRFWLYLTRHGVSVTDYDLIDIYVWIEQGGEGLKSSVSSKEFEFYNKHSADLEQERQLLRKLVRQRNFTYYRRRPELQDLLKALKTGAVAEVTLNPYTLRGKDGFAVHRVVVLHFLEDTRQFIIHDPDNETPHPFWQVDYETFVNAWLEGLDSPELAVYKE